MRINLERVLRQWCQHQHVKPSIATIIAGRVVSSSNSISGSSNRRRSFGTWSSCALSIGGKATSTPLILSPAEATRILRANESTVDIESKSAIKYYDINYLGANNPAEDRQTQAKFLYSDLYLFGVFDGHGGYYCSDTISQRVFDYIALNFLTSKQLEEKLKVLQPQSQGKEYPLWFAYQSPYADLRTTKLKDLHRLSLHRYAEDLLRERIMEESIGNDDLEPNIEKILNNAFLRLDADLTAEALPDPIVSGGRASPPDKETLDVIMSGSCACVALLSGKELYLANTGDARAIIGQENDDGTFTPFRMSNEHNAENADEVKRLLKEHPNEQNTLIRDGRLLEMLLPFRAFGDMRFKLTAKQIKDHIVPVYGHGALPSHYYSPPYVTVRPEIIHRRLNYKDKFLILATDGLWDLLTPEKVVQLIGDHLNGQQSFDPYMLPDDGSTVKLRDVFEDLTKRRVSIKNQPLDHNSATHLIRYALGNDHITLSNYLRADTPRNFRDDITITVVYFNTDYIIESFE